MTQYTPAPWEWSNQYKSSNGESTWSLVSNDGYGILSCDGEENSPQRLGSEGKANAALICAAPDLLDALEYVLNEYVDRHDNSETVIKARATIAKAKQLTNNNQ